MANNNMKTVTLRSSDKVDFEVSAAVASKSQVIHRLIEDESSDCVQKTTPIYNVDAKTLSKVIEYCTMHTASNPESEKELAPDHDDHQLDLKQWDAEFIDNVDLGTLYNLLNAANYLDIRELLDLACQKVANLVKGKSPEMIRELFAVKNDFTPEEEEEIRRKHAWAFNSLL